MFTSVWWWLCASSVPLVMTSSNKFHFLRPDREKIDVSEVLELLENGNISDIEGGESEDENEVNRFYNLFSGKCTIFVNVGFSFV